MPDAPSPEEQPGKRRGGGIFWVLALIALGAVVFFVFTGDEAPDSAATAVATASPEPTVEQTLETPDAAGTSDEESTAAPGDGPTPTPLTPEEERVLALKALESVLGADRERQPVHGQWVAQLASKYEGITDTSQQPDPFTVGEILEEEHATARDNPEYGDLVRLIQQGDWGDTEPHDPPMWVTIVDLGYTSRGEVTTWCEEHFAQRGDALLNVCYPRELRIP